jgi:hypothetical protein
MAAAMSLISAFPGKDGLKETFSKLSQLDVTISMIAATSMLLPFKESEISNELRLDCCSHKKGIYQLVKKTTLRMSTHPNNKNTNKLAHKHNQMKQ